MSKLKLDEETGKYKATFNILDDLDVYEDLPTPQHTQDVVNFILDCSLTPEQKAKAEAIREAPEAAQKLWLMALQVQHHHKVPEFSAELTKSVAGLIPNKEMSEKFVKSMKDLNKAIDDHVQVNRKTRRREFKLMKRKLNKNAN